MPTEVAHSLVSEESSLPLLEDPGITSPGVLQKDVYSQDPLAAILSTRVISHHDPGGNY